MKKFNFKDTFNIRKNTKVKVGILIFICLILGISIFSISRSLMEEQVEIKSVEIKSDGWDDEEPGAWKITKSAEWTSTNTAKLTLNVETLPKFKDENVAYDVVLALDVAQNNSSKEPKVDALKESLNDYIPKILENSNNKIALVEFYNSANVLSELTNDREKLVRQINLLQNKCDSGTMGDQCRSYTNGLSGVETALKEYTPSEKRKLVVLFFTDGNPKLNVGSINSTFNNLKRKFPEIDIETINFNMGEENNSYLSIFSNSQHFANSRNLYEKLYWATYKDNLEIYDDFKIDEFIDSDYFYINSESYIKADLGEFAFDSENQKVEWNIENNLYTSQGAILTINATLKDEYASRNGYYSTSKQTNILTEEDSFSNKTTPILKNYFTVKFDANPPSNCAINLHTGETHFVFENVNKNIDVSACTGYQFKGWEIIGDTKLINADTFVMPTHDLEVKGTWSKLDISKSLDGKIRKKLTLWEQVKYDSENTKDAYKYPLDDVEEDIYFYKSKERNNVIFAGFCWQMIRTTDTGGVKMMYAGVPVNGTCMATGASQGIGWLNWNSPGNSAAYIGYMFNSEKLYVQKGTSGLGTYSFGNSVKYENGQYTLVDTISGHWSSMWNNINYNHYTCFNTTGVCSTVYYIYYTSSSYAYYIELNSGNTVEDALNDTLHGPDVNKDNSAIKTYIDNWYKANIDDKGYTSFIEDTVYCGDRRLSVELEHNGYNPNGGYTTGETLTYRSQIFNNPSYYDLSCPNIDKFTVSKENGNGSLTYPVGLIDASEAYFIGESLLLNGTWYYILTGTGVSSYGYLGSAIITQRYANDPLAYGHFGMGSCSIDNGCADSATPTSVRPVISLKPGIKYKSGYGTIYNPYIIE